MDPRVSLGSCLMSLLLAALILTHGVWAVGTATAYTDHGPFKKVEASKSSLVYTGDSHATAGVNHLPLFYHWIAKAFAVVNASTIGYHNCQALLVHPTSFNPYYTHLSALAP